MTPTFRMLHNLTRCLVFSTRYIAMRAIHFVFVRMYCDRNRFILRSFVFQIGDNNRVCLISGVSKAPFGSNFVRYRSPIFRMSFSRCASVGKLMSKRGNNRDVGTSKNKRRKDNHRLPVSFCIFVSAAAFIATRGDGCSASVWPYIQFWYIRHRGHCLNFDCFFAYFFVKGKNA